MQRERVHSADILRGLLAVGVMLYHYSYWLPLGVPQPLLSISHKVGIYAVEGFFVISGFSLYSAYRDRPPREARSFLSYLCTRGVRLVPLFAMGILFSKEVHIFQTDLLRVVSNFTLTFGFVDPSLSLIVGGWSISVEVVLSVLLPILLIAQIRIRHWFLIVVALTCIPLYFFQGEQLYVQVPNHLLFFAAGIYIGFLRTTLTTISSKAFWAVFAILVGAFYLIGGDATALQQFLAGTNRIYLTIVTICIVALFCLYDFDETPVVFSGLTLLGEGSYSVYLLHPIVYERLIRKFDGAPTLVVYFTLSATTVLLAIVVYQCFERPVTKWFKASSRPKLVAVSR